jgi:hypothetical protein
LNTVQVSRLVDGSTYWRVSDDDFLFLLLFLLLPRDAVAISLAISLVVGLPLLLILLFYSFKDDNQGQSPYYE